MLATEGVDTPTPKGARANLGQNIQPEAAKRTVVQTATLDTGQVPQEHQQVTFEKERTGEISGLDGYLPFYQDLEAVHSISDLIRSIYEVIQNAPSTTANFRSRIAKWSPLLPSKISGVELATSKQTWQVLLSTAFDDLFKIARDQVILLLWDEFPLMLYNIQRTEGSDCAIQLLDHLRTLRLTHAPRLRFLFTGSVGLHLVLRSLRRAGNTNDPVNDMLSLTVSPITDENARNLAEALLGETRAAARDVPELAASIVKQVSGFPYYVHHVVDQLDQLRREPSLEDVTSVIDRLVDSSQDPANLNYYVSRLSSYYSDEERDIALVVLDTLAGALSTVPTTVLFNLCRHRRPSLDDDSLRDILKVLAEDHYIDSVRVDEEIGYEFRWPLVKKWWKETRK